MEHGCAYEPLSDFFLVDILVPTHHPVNNLAILLDTSKDSTHTSISVILNLNLWFHVQVIPSGCPLMNSIITILIITCIGLGFRLLRRAKQLGWPIALLNDSSPFLRSWLLRLSVGNSRLLLPGG